MQNLEKLQNEFSELFIDAFLSVEETNMFYLTGFNLTQGDGFVFVTSTDTYIITDARFEAALSEVDVEGIKVLITQNYVDGVIQIQQKLGLEVIGIENDIQLRLYDDLVDQIDADIEPTNNVIEQLRIIKSSSEIEKITAAAKMSSDGFDFLINHIDIGMSEIEVANLIDWWMKKNGASKSSFDTIVASGVNAAKPHATAGSKVIQKGDVVIIDYGYFFEGYTSDITRTIAFDNVDSEFKEIYNLVLTASKKVIDTAKNGVSGQTLDQAGRSIIENSEYGQFFNHGMGHGIGLSVHEEPSSYGPNSNVTIETNQIITVEPGIYVPERGGVRIEDDILVTENGCRVLTTATKELLIL